VEGVKLKFPKEIWQDKNPRSDFYLTTDNLSRDYSLSEFSVTWNPIA